MRYCLVAVPGAFRSFQKSQVNETLLYIRILSHIKTIIHVFRVQNHIRIKSCQCVMIVTPGQRSWSQQISIQNYL